MKPFELQAWPRLHLGLIDCGSATARLYGGAGFAIEALPLVLAVEPSQTFDLIGFDAIDSRGRDSVHSAISRANGGRDAPPCKLRLISSIPEHVGLGSRTALLLAVITSLHVARGELITISKIQSLSGRGGTSGIGSHSFFTGGFLVDSGHLRHGQQSHQPSGAVNSKAPPPLSVRMEFPATWTVMLLMPDGIRRSGKSEIEFFESNTPIPDREVLLTLSAVYHGLVPAIREANLGAFAAGLMAIQKTGFKRRELGAQDEGVRSLLERLRNLDQVACGMSSLGPLVCAIHESSNREASAQIRTISAQEGCSILATCPGANRGYEVKEL